MEIFNGYKLRSAVANKYSVVNVEDFRHLRGLSTIELQNNAIAVDFAKQDSFLDPNSTSMCIVVLSSDGSIGTVSHLQTDADTDRAAQTVLEFHGQPTGLCLAGGNDMDSEDLLEKIISSFTSRGFVLSLDRQHSDIGGNQIRRQSELHPSYVNVVRRPYIGQVTTSVLTFPQF